MALHFRSQSIAPINPKYVIIVYNRFARKANKIRIDTFKSYVRGKSNEYIEICLRSLSGNEN